VAPERVHGMKPMTIFSSVLNEKPTTPLSERWGGDVRRIGTVRVRSSTTNFVLDNSIDWRNRIVWGWIVAAPLLSVALAPEAIINTTTPNNNSAAIAANHTATNNVNFAQVTFTGRGFGGANLVFGLSADASGNLVLAVTNPVDNDYWTLILFATDRFLATV